MDLTTSARVQRLLESGGASVGQHAALLADLIPGVSARMEEYLGRVAQSGSRVEYYDAEPGLVRILLDAYPISSVTDLRYDPVRAYDASSVVSSSEYAVDLDRGIVTFDPGQRWQVAPRAIRVSYSGGMAANTNAFIAAFPALAHAADLQTANLIQRRLALGTSSIYSGGKAFAGGYELLPEVTAILDLYRRRG